MTNEKKLQLMKLYHDASEVFEEGGKSVNEVHNEACEVLFGTGVKELDDLGAKGCVLMNRDLEEGTTFDEWITMCEEYIEEITGVLGEFFGD